MHQAIRMLHKHTCARTYALQFSIFVARIVFEVYIGYSCNYTTHSTEIDRNFTHYHVSNKILLLFTTTQETGQCDSVYLSHVN